MRLWLAWVRGLDVACKDELSIGRSPGPPPPVVTLSTALHRCIRVHRATPRTPASSRECGKDGRTKNRGGLAKPCYPRSLRRVKQADRGREICWDAWLLTAILLAGNFEAEGGGGPLVDTSPRACAEICCCCSCCVWAQTSFRYSSPSCETDKPGSWVAFVVPDAPRREPAPGTSLVFTHDSQTKKKSYRRRPSS